jgi:hypothetical protein
MEGTICNLTLYFVNKENPAGKEKISDWKLGRASTDQCKVLVTIKGPSLVRNHASGAQLAADFV